MSHRLTPFMLIVALSLSAACAAPKSNNTLSSSEAKDGWQLLFDGKTSNGWRGFRKKTCPAAWKVIDGTLTLTGRGGDIATEKQFDNFELSLDWNISPKGNSGIFYRCSEHRRRSHETGPEYQILDNGAAKYKKAKYDAAVAGANYGLYKPDRSACKPAGQWNHTRIIVQGNHVEHWLNGKKVVEYELLSPDWKKRVAKSKFKRWSDYGKMKKGHIVLQDHKSRVSFRNIKIRPLKVK